MGSQRCGSSGGLSATHRRAGRRQEPSSPASMRIAIRDDDTCYFTSPVDLEQVYGDVWQRIPICLATVPFTVGYPRAGFPEAEWHSGRRFARERNPVLVAWLRRMISEGRVTIALRGYTHED